MAFMGDPMLGALSGELLSAILYVMTTVSNFKSDLQRLQSTLETLLPQIEVLNRLDSELDLQRLGRSEPIHRLKQLLIEGKDLVFKCSKVNTFNFYQKYRYSKKFLKLDESLVRFFQVDVQNEIWLEMKQLLVYVVEANRKLDRSSKKFDGRGIECAPGRCVKTTLASNLCNFQEIPDIVLSVFWEEITNILHD